MPPLAGNYLRKEITKANRPQTDQKLTKLIDHFADINEYEHLGSIEMEEKGIVPKAVQSPRHTNTGHS